MLAGLKEVTLCYKQIIIIIIIIITTIITITIIFIMLFLVYLVDLYNLVKKTYSVYLIISGNDVRARKLNEPFGYLVRSLANLGSR